MEEPVRILSDVLREELKQILREVIREEIEGANTRNTSNDNDRLLTPSEAAQILGETKRWLYRHSYRLPFTRRLSRKSLRFSEAGLRKWMSTRKP